MDLTAQNWSSLNTNGGPADEICYGKNSNSFTGANFLNSAGTTLGVSNTCDTGDKLDLICGEFLHYFYVHADETCSTSS